MLAAGFTVRRTLSEATGGKSLNENSPKGTNTPEETAEYRAGIWIESALFPTGDRKSVV